MTDRQAIHQETHDGVASSGLEALETLKREFKGLNESAHDKAKAITPAAQNLNVAWDDLLPDLDKMQSLLSQRGESRELLRDAHLPTWSRWWKSFQKETGLSTTLHTVQVRLKKFRSMGEPTDEPKRKRKPTVHLSPVNQMRVLAKLQCANELAKAINAGVEYRHLLGEFLSPGIDSEHIERWITDIRTGAEAFESSPTPTVPAAPAPASMAGTTVISPEPVRPAKPLMMPTASDGSSLFNLVNNSCGPHIGAALEGISPEMMATILRDFLSKLVGMHCKYDHGAGEITVKVEYINAKRSVVDKAA